MTNKKPPIQVASRKFGWAAYASLRAAYCKEIIEQCALRTAYPSYQVPLRERRVPFLLVKFTL